jgi:hypothetical protein
MTRKKIILTALVYTVLLFWHSIEMAVLTETGALVFWGAASYLPRLSETEWNNFKNKPTTFLNDYENDQNLARKIIITTSEYATNNQNKWQCPSVIKVLDNIVLFALPKFDTLPPNLKEEYAAFFTAFEERKRKINEPSPIEAKTPPNQIAFDFSGSQNYFFHLTPPYIIGIGLLVGSLGTYLLLTLKEKNGPKTPKKHLKEIY